MNENRVEWVLQDEEATGLLATALAKSQPGPAVVHLQGDLGAGKSTLARAWLRALDVTGAIPSPTYTLMESYQTAEGKVLHLDLYRIANAGELEFLGLDELTPRLWLVEWPERARRGLPPVDLQVQLMLAGAGRLALIVAKSPLGCAWLESPHMAIHAKHGLK